MATLTYEESAALMKDEAFRGRISVACLKFADYIFGETASTPAHSTRIRWAQQAFAAPETAAMQVQPPVVMDPAVQQDGAAITDVNLQSAVENTINKML
jgi:hypothetical protein